MTTHGDPFGEQPRQPASGHEWPPPSATPEAQQARGAQQAPGSQPDAGSGTPAQPTQPFWYGQPAPGTPASSPSGHGGFGGHDVPAGHGAPGGPSGVGTLTGQAPAKPRRLVELTSVALLAALLASGTTYAVTDHDSATSGTSSSALGAPSTQSGSTPVVQASATAPDWSATAAAVSPSVVAISVTTSQGGAEGSGVLLDPKGHVVTNNHVVASLGSGATIRVTLNDKRSYAASIVGTDPSTDLAVLKLQSPPDDLTAISFGNAEKLRVGQPVMAVGNPLGLAGTVTTGIVSALNRPVSTSTAQQPDPNQDPFGQQQQQSTADTVVTNAVQTSAAINPGNSGGALVDANGALVGINSSIASLGGSSSGSSGESGNIGIGFAIPVNEVRSIAQQLIDTGKAQHAFLGVSSADANVKDGTATRAAARITKVSSGTPAAKAGLKVGDAVTAVNGDSVDSALSLVAQIRELSIGEKATLTVVNGGAKRQVTVTLAAKPAGQ